MSSRSVYRGLFLAWLKSVLALIELLWPRGVVKLLQYYINQIPRIKSYVKFLYIRARSDIGLGQVGFIVTQNPTQ